ncbi:hypothetical protein RHSIM_Rhsim06G0018200 [Rhododendron simsii]|uniref:GDSL esterase/lipase EXL3 n=1 Tax=Rhododendron simsii TaxID=118357 RepID=A0A834GSA0_RHOSS|nr:hypothetical protein RHSIM_Rhsim06G0018200 [Rhododendron simsii]
MKLCFLSASSSRSIVLFSVSILLIFGCSSTDAVIRLPENMTIPAVLVFGDSIVDQGNNNGLVATLAKSNFPPYGQDFMGGLPTGRMIWGAEAKPNGLKSRPGFSSIKGDAEELGIKELLPAYLDPNLQAADLLTGVSFASGGVGFDPQTAQVAACYSFDDELKMFREYIGKIKGTVGEDRANFVITNSLYFVVAGSDDLANTYFTLGIRKLQYDINSYTDFMARSACDFVKEVYALGAKRIAFFGTPPIGCLPSQRTLAGGPTRACAENYNQAAKLYNTKVKAALSSLSNSLDDAQVRIVYIDIYNPLLGLIQNYGKYGFSFADKGCCGSGKIESAVTCNKLSGVCSDDSKYLFWDSYHPTERAYQVIVDMILQKYINDFLSSTDAVIRLPENITIPAVLVFGDSIVDQGNNNKLIATLAKSNFPPYGKDFMGGIPTGRFCNGKTPPDLLAEELGVKELVPAYLDPNLQAADLLTGVSFASGGTGFDPQTAQIAACFSLDDQLKMFRGYIGKIEGIVGEDRANFVLTNSLYFVVAGSDDLANTYFGLGIRKLQYDINSYTDFMVRSACDFVKEVYALGAKRIAYFGTPPIGCLPSQRTLAGGGTRECAENYNQAAKLYNTKIKSALSSLSNSLNDAQVRIVYIDIYNPLFTLIQNHGKYGFSIADTGCCGSGKIEAAVLCNKFSSADAVIRLPENVTLPALLVFGDSIVDQGNNNKLNAAFAKSNFPPYGKDFMGGIPTGRFCNGKTPPDLIVEELGIKELVPAYLDPNLQAADLLTGVSFASGGTGFDPLTAKITEVYALGAKRIAFFGTPPIGCLPSQRTLAGGRTRVCAEKYNQAAKLYNTKIKAALSSLSDSLNDAQVRIVYIDIYNPLYALIQNHEKYGFSIADKGCCGSGKIEFALLLKLPSSSSSIVYLCVFLLLRLYIAMAVIRLPHNVTIPAVIMFGDSIVDTGNNNNLKTIFKVNYPPYGKDFIGGVPTGRFSNGKVPSDLLVEELGIKELLPAYLDPNLQIQDLSTGVNFASGGAGFDPLTSELASVISLSDQLDLFKEYLAKLKGVVGEARTSVILANSLYVVVAGANDITNTYFSNPLRKLHFDVPSYTDLMVTSASSFVQDLYGLGARRIGVFGIPPIGCVPSQRTLGGGPQRDCVEKYNEAARLFNTKLSLRLNSFNCNLPLARIVYIDAYDLPLDLLRNPDKYGFEIGNKGCCGTGVVEVAFLCSYTCANVSEYVFWDSFHLTEKAYKIMVHQIAEKYISSFF